jgi:uncharacterized protein YdhG (YjbR/CyaY superfamily)
MLIFNQLQTTYHLPPTTYHLPPTTYHLPPTTMSDIDHYIAKFPLDTQEILNQVRAVIIKTAPDAVEGMAYGMPGYKTNGKPLCYFAGYKNHIGFYATPNGHEAFAKEFSKYKQGKGSVQFPITEPMPLKLIESVVKFRVKENQKK